MGQLALAMASDPHMVLAMASVIPGLGEVAAAADMALYLYQGDYQNAALAAALFLPGGAMFAVGAGLRGAREVMSLARAGAKDLSAVMEGSRIVRGLREAGTAVKDVLSIVGSRVKGWVGRGEQAFDAEADAWRVSGSVPATGRTIRSAPSLSELRQAVAEEAQIVASRGLGHLDSKLSFAQREAASEQRWRIWQYRGSAVHDETFARLQARYGRDWVRYSPSKGLDFTFGNGMQVELTTVGSVGSHVRAPRSIPLDQVAT